MTRSLPIRGKIVTKSASPPPKPETSTRLRKMREARGLGATEIAQKVGVTRQTIHAIESGDYVPNTAVALQLARVLEVRVEDLFSLSAENSDQAPVNINAALLASSNDQYSAGELVSVARVGSHMVAAPSPRFPTFLSDADGAIAKRNKTRAMIRPSTELARLDTIASCWRDVIRRFRFSLRSSRTLAPKYSASIARAIRPFNGSAKD